MLKADVLLVNGVELMCVVVLLCGMDDVMVLHVTHHDSLRLVLSAHHSASSFAEKVESTVETQHSLGFHRNGLLRRK